MAQSESQSLPERRSLDELVDYFDTHDMGEHLEKMPEVDIEVDITESVSRKYLGLDAEPEKDETKA